MSKSSGQSRRDFLRGKLQTSDQKGENSSSEESDESNRLETDCVQYFSRRAMACDFEIYFNHLQHEDAADAAMECFQRIEEMEDFLSIYRPDSPISKFNDLGPGDSLTVAPAVFEVLELGRRLTEATEGAFDMTSAILSELWGFSRRQGELPQGKAIEGVLEWIGNSNWDLNSSDLNLTKRGADSKLNLGAIGKGFALDQCRSIMDRFGIEDYLIHGGNSSVLANGNRYNERKEKGWWVNVSHPIHADQSIAELLIHNRALATSGTRRQGFVNAGKWYGHIIDPRNGYPPDHVYSCTVLAPTAAEADALSTAFYVMGFPATREFCKNRTDVSVLMVLPGEKSGYQLKTIHLNESDLDS